MYEPLKNLFTMSRSLTLDFKSIDPATPDDENIEKYFQSCESRGENPRRAVARQAFNDHVLDKTGKKYLISHYGEDRSAMLAGSSIANEGRTLHLGVDVFCKDLEIVYSPFDGKIVRVGREPEHHSFGYYLIIKPDNPNIPHIFLGHLGKDLSQASEIKMGEPVGKLGDYKDNENGGWSRHLHIQMCKNLPKEGKAPVGYATKDQFLTAESEFPSPMDYFSEWKIDGY